MEEINEGQKEVFQYACSQCGIKAPQGDDWEHAKEVAKESGFQFRPVAPGGFKILCDECGSVKQMRATDIKHYEKKCIEKV